MTQTSSIKADGQSVISSGTAVIAMHMNPEMSSKK